MKDLAAEIGLIGAKCAVLSAQRYGAKAHWLSRAAALELPVPPAVVLPDSVLAAPETRAEALVGAVAHLEAATGCGFGDPARPLLLALRPSAGESAGAATPALLDLGICEAALPALGRRLGEHAAVDLYRRLIQSYGTAVLELEGEAFEYALHDTLKEAGAQSEIALDAAQLRALARTCLRLIAEEGERFPEDPGAQLSEATAAMLRAWSGPRARMRRIAKGLPESAPLALILQPMVLGLGPEPSGAGLAQFRDTATGASTLTGLYLPQAQGEDVLMGLRTPLVLTEAEAEARGLRDPALDSLCARAVETLRGIGERLERALAETFTLEFTLAEGEVWVLELSPARCSARAAVRLTVELAESGAIDRAEALRRTDPALLDEHLHPSIDPVARRDVIGQGLPASPGAASGQIVFSPEAAEAAAADGRPAILALIETGPEDIRGMHVAQGILTVRGGMTSHAAVVARGLGRPCVVGIKSLMLDRRNGLLRVPDGRVFHAGDSVTVDGSEGQVLAGTVDTVPPDITGAFATLMRWSDAERELGIRANADTGEDARTALGFAARGIGLCRTEHMFFQHGRIAAMREMILAESETARRTALEKLQPMQRADFVDLFREMAGFPVVIRLLDPPLHEFLPHGEDEMAEMAASLDLPVARVKQRALELAEFNPMLGRRGCRIGIAYPEIYEMQARAIFEAACDAAEATGAPVRPEIMIPLVSAVRELELLRARIDGVAETVRAERGVMIEFTVGVMIETPRACLRAGDIAASADFLSFGTNDLTQMLYGLSRDDAGRFMPDYVAQGVFGHDPFHRIDEEGVGEIIRLAIERARAAHPGISIGLCGEHGGDPASVDFCQRAGFDYVSCSPFRVPIARLAAAQAALMHPRGAEAGPG